MQIPEPPQKVEDLDLMKLLHDYGEGKKTWNKEPVGSNMQSACRKLSSNIEELVKSVLNYLLDKIPMREMSTFTLHDRSHGIKVAHLMWHILKPERRERLTPPEIGLMVITAYFHDLGMALSDREREDRYNSSELRDMLELQENLKRNIEKLHERMTDEALTKEQRDEAARRLVEAQEALLSDDTRERHATRERYEELLKTLTGLHAKSPERIADINACLAFNGTSFRTKLIDICVSHNETAIHLIDQDPGNPRWKRFPVNYPLGSCSADLHMVAAALRLADILDFDRERTPAVLFYYLLPGSLGDMENRTFLEWSKHLSIDHWHINTEDAKPEIIFEAHCDNHIVHHTIVKFCETINQEISATNATFGESADGWPFILPLVVKDEIYSEGYSYFPYTFELDDERIYKLLMGNAIYDNPIIAVREIIQNAVDACKLHDAQTRLRHPYAQPGEDDRIIIRYEEPTSDCSTPRLIIKDTGTGMSKEVIKNWFLKVGRSYYSSNEFARTRIQLRHKGLDFAPVSEFGIGFLSCFMLADRVCVETAMWSGDDTRKSILTIDGPTRLMHMETEPNTSSTPLSGTHITLFLTRGSETNKENDPPTWDEIASYLDYVCVALPYSLRLEHDNENPRYLRRHELKADVSSHLEVCTLRIPIDDEEFGLEGEIALIDAYRAQETEKQMRENSPVFIVDDDMDTDTHSELDTERRFREFSDLLRGGFRIDDVPGTPDDRLAFYSSSNGIISLKWQSSSTHRFLLTNLARDTITNRKVLAERIARLWITHLLNNLNTLQEHPLAYHAPDSHEVTLSNCNWLETYDALTLYRFARHGWLKELLMKNISEETFVAWEECTEGALLPITDSGMLHSRLLNIILPNVTKKVLDGKGDLYVKSPPHGWQQILKDWRNFVTSPTSWSYFVEFADSINNFLFYRYSYDSGRLNARYQNRFASFSREEIEKFLSMLRERISSNTRGIHLDREQLQLLKRAILVAGDLEISTRQGRWRLDSLELPSEDDK